MFWKQNPECLAQDLLKVHPNKGESPLDFGKRLQVLRSHWIQRVVNFPEVDMSRTTKSVYLRQYEELAVRIIHTKSYQDLYKQVWTLTRNYNLHIFKEQFQLYPEQLETTTIKQDTFQSTIPNQQTKLCYYVTSSHDNPYFRPNFQHNMNFNQPIRPNFNTPFNYVMDNRQNFQRFPSQPIQIQSSPVYRNCPTDKQDFGPPTNAFAPTCQAPIN